VAHLVALVGNGLSVAANERLRLAALTASFLDAHADDRDDLDRLLAEVDLGAVDPATDFEGIVAGLESAEEVVSAFMREPPHLRSAPRAQMCKPGVSDRSRMHFSRSNEMHAQPPRLS
jgi:hypothetical protein